MLVFLHSGFQDVNTEESRVETARQHDGQDCRENPCLVPRALGKGWRCLVVIEDPFEE